MGRPLEYILHTARSWHGPIGTFTLTIDKGARSRLVSLCADGVRRTGPGTFEVRRQDYRPNEDLHVLFIDQPVQ